MALTYLGLPECSDDPTYLKRAISLIQPQLRRDNIATISTAIDFLAGDRVVVGMAWNGDALRARARKASLRYAYPREGVTLWVDTVVMPKAGANHKEALAFMDFLLRPENIALQSNFTHYANAIRGSDRYLSPELLDSPEVIVPSHVKLNFHQFCPSGVTVHHVNVWEQAMKEGMAGNGSR